MYDARVRAEALALVTSGRSLNTVSKRLGVSRAAIREWLRRPDALDVAGRCPAPAAPSPEYSALLGFYLGDGCLSAHPRTYALRVACDKNLAGIVEDVVNCVRAVHPERRTYLVPAEGVVVVQSYWKHWPCLFPQHGPGRKHERVLDMADWQWQIVERHPADFLRGLFHSDGCRVNNWTTRVVAGEKKRYDYPRWQFVNESADIMGWCGEALDLVGIAWRQTSPRTLSVSTRAAVAQLDALIGPKR
ncbi:MAG TPA: helix-turn-helix domain-containing protein [Marmoricola sp.]|nr:helix-turn-helix domain-containing protein [Marmoricola sp.]